MKWTVQWLIMKTSHLVSAWNRFVRVLITSDRNCWQFSFGESVPFTRPFHLRDKRLKMNFTTVFWLLIVVVSVESQVSIPTQVFNKLLRPCREKFGVEFMTLNFLNTPRTREEQCNLACEQKAFGVVSWWTLHTFLKCNMIFQMTPFNTLNLEAYAQFFDLRYTPSLLPSILSCAIKAKRLNRIIDECEAAGFFQRCISRKVKSNHAQAYDVFNLNEKPQYKLFRKYWVKLFE